MPALNIIAIHARLPNSGSASSLPSRIRPNRLKAMRKHSTRKTSAATTNSQPKLPSTQFSAVSVTDSKFFLPSAAQATTASTAATPAPTRTRSGGGSCAASPGAECGVGSSDVCTLMASHYGRKNDASPGWRADRGIRSLFAAARAG